MPGIIGDGAKWLCGATLHPQPCRILSLGSNFDDRFERSMYDAVSCASHIVDPTLRSDHSRNVSDFEGRIASYHATLNRSVGVGHGQLHHRGGSAPLVSLRALLRDRYPEIFTLSSSATPFHIAVIKGTERTSSKDRVMLCSVDVVRCSVDIDGI
jgi:hypothetical protein